MTSQSPHPLHKGELDIQKRMKSPTEISRNLPHYIDPSMPWQHKDFYTRLPYLAVATIDADGRPWATLLVTASDIDHGIGIASVSQNELNVHSMTTNMDPFVRALNSRRRIFADEQLLFAGVGVDFSNRRRNKLAGNITDYSMPGKDRLHIVLNSDQHLGNCPKYITVRDLEPYARQADLAFDGFESFGGTLDRHAQKIIARSSTVYLATRHLPESNDFELDKRDMGLNHRGGAPGFVRIEQSGGHSSGLEPVTHLVLPDHSGNRFYQSLGNVQTDPQVGITFPDFSTGDVLYLTGLAENLFGEEAETVMPRVSLITRIRITGAVHIRQSLNLRMSSSEQYSPYNPPIRFLRTELTDIHNVREPQTTDNERIRATLVKTQDLSDSIKRFTFELSKPVNLPLPGGFGIFDFSEYFRSEYKHMNDLNPQAVNDDYIRTWTISSAGTYDVNKKGFANSRRIDITVKHKIDGSVSSFLHDHGPFAAEHSRSDLAVDFIGSGGGFSCFSHVAKNEPPTIPERMLWIAGGVGITPFLAMWDGILSLANAIDTTGAALTTDIVLAFAARDDDINVLRHFLKERQKRSANVRLRIMGFQTSHRNGELDQENTNSILSEYSSPLLEIQQQRIDRATLSAINNLTEREIFLCGPDAFMRHSESCLEAILGTELTIRKESYSF
ncbi:MAG: oxidoreductase [Pseudomonadota bacterium]